MGKYTIVQGYTCEIESIHSLLIEPALSQTDHNT